MDEQPSLVVRQALGVLTAQAIHHADVPGLRQERVRRPRSPTARSAR